MLRRFEIYSLRRDAEPAASERLRHALGECGRFIPEVLHSAVGSNVSSVPLHLAWEHAYASAEAYQRYMTHPYHAAVLDRFLLTDSPERIVSDNGLGAGLVGYTCATPIYRLTRGVRRLVLLRIADGAGAADLQSLDACAAEARAHEPALLLSIFAANTFATRWFDGVTPIGGPPRWTHLLEQGFRSLGDLAAYRQGATELARAERDGWSAWRGGLVEAALEVTYEIEPGWGYDR